MILDWFQLSFMEWVLVAFLQFVFFIQLFFYIHYYRGILKQSRRIHKGKVVLEKAQPPVTVIICARDQAENLEIHLPAILDQNYPEFQVVVVNDASTDETENVLNRFVQIYPNLYHTFVPEGVQSVSAKKMAMSIGIKAAKFDILLFTEANCTPNSREWIASMMRHFDANCGIVLGFSSYLERKGLLNRLISYDTLFSSIQYMGFSESGKPYMGIGRNLAYRKELFFKNRGFASYLYLQSGEDDLFIGEVANSTNTRIEISPESKVYSNTSNVWNHWKEMKKNHISTSAYYKAGTQFRTGTEILSRFLFYGLFAVLLVMGLIKGNIPLIVFAGGLFIIRYTIQFIILNRSAKCLNERRHYFFIALFDTILPFISFWFKIEKLFQRGDTYTWKVLH